MNPPMKREKPMNFKKDIKVVMLLTHRQGTRVFLDISEFNKKYYNMNIVK